LLEFDTPVEGPLCSICHNPTSDGHVVYHHPPQFQCHICGRLFFRKGTLNRHIASGHRAASEVVGYKPGGRSN